MHVLLLCPSSRSTFRSLGVELPPLGLLYVAAAVRNRGYSVRVIDLSVDSQSIAYSEFDVVGIHSDTTRFTEALALARRAKAAGSRVVMGGPHPCFVAEAVLETGMVDAIVRGEGERTFPDLLDAWSKGDDPALIPGLIVATPHGTVDTGDPVHIVDVDSIAFPARDLIDLSNYTRAHLGYRRLASIHTSRGCPHQCRFCSSSRFDGVRWRARSAESVLDELEYLVRALHYGAVTFVDDNFTGSPERIHAICDGILSKGLDIHWWCFCRIDTIVRHPDMIRHMALAGATSIFTGVETPSPGVLKHLNKGINPDQARQAVEILKENGLEIWASYILGAPEEGRQDIRSTIRFACELDSHIAQFTLLTPYPGTVLYDELERRITERDWRKFDALHAVYRHARMSRLELQLWLVWAYVSFYTRHTKARTDFLRFLVNRRRRGAASAAFEA